MAVQRSMFDDTHEQFRSAFRMFLEREVVPNRERWDDAGIVDRELFAAAGATTTTTTQPPGNEGCTPGYWKNHPGPWAATGFVTGNSLESVFDVPDWFGLDNNTLLEALSFSGGSDTIGGARILLRAGVAALLNSASPDVNYPMSPADVISGVNAALASGDRATMLSLASSLDADNNLSCPL